MIFVLEQAISNRKAKIKAWEKARDEWVKAGGNYYRSNQDYEEKHPRPGLRWDRITSSPLFIVPVVMVLAIGLSTFITMSQPPPDPKNPHGCSTLVKKGDLVGVHGGDFDGSKGTVIEQKDDCSVNLTLTVSTYTLERCNQVNRGYCDKAKENGTILNVDRSQNIIKL